MSDKRIYKLSSSETIVYLDCMEPTTAYNIPLLLPLDGLDAGKMADAVRRFFDLHPHLFMRLCIDGEGEVGKYIEKTPLDIPEICVSSISDIKMRYFDMLDAPLYRVEMYNVGGKMYLFFDFHHIIFDGTSLKLFIDGIFSLYEGKSLPPEEYDAELYSEWENEERGGALFERAKEYFFEKFGALECSSVLPFDKNDGKATHKVIKRTLDTKRADVGAFVKRAGVKTSTFFISVFSYLLATLNMEKEALVATVHNGRKEKLKNTVGMFVKTLPFYARFDDDMSVSEYLSSCNAQLIESVENEIYSFVDAARDLSVSSDIIFAYQGDYFYKTTSGGREYRFIDVGGRDGKNNMSVELHRDGDSFVIWYEYRSDLYDDVMIEHIIDLYDIALTEFMTRGKIGEIDLCSAGELANLDKMNAVDAELLQSDKTVLDYFYEHLSRDPSHTLVEFGDKKYTYAEGDEISNKIANKLKSLGAKRENVVSVLIPKCEYTVIASLGVIKSGAAYQPLDPSYPTERLSFMMKDAGAEIVILDRALDSLIPDFDGARLYLDEIDALTDASRPETLPRPDDLFIMLYTSGTTGLPKGVMLEHKNIVAFCRYCNKAYGEDASSKMSAYASYGFDANMMDLYTAITAGGTVCIIPEDMRLDLVRLGEYFNKTGITHSLITTQVGRQVVEEIELKTVRHFFVGGEKLVPVEPPKNYVLHNAYGPTEGTVFCTEHPVDKLYYRVPIGKNISTYKFYVLNAQGKRVPWGVKGELYISGPQVARGYLNRPEENKKAFGKNPFDSDPRFEKLYKTGDVVRLLCDGTVDFIGRNDGQVKIRGFRVELTEVEQIIRKFPKIKDATVKDFTDPSGIKFIAAYIVSDEKIDVNELNAFIGKNKPPYMIPAFTMQIDKIPLNQNQKVNKRALPEPKMEAAEIVMPDGEDEKKVYDILASIVGHTSFGVTTDVYAAGLTSVTAIKLTVQLSKAFSKTVKISDITQNPTARALAKFIGGASYEKTFEKRDKYPLTKTQEGIFVECISRPETTAYNIPFLFKLDRKIDVSRLCEAIKATLSAHRYVMSALGTDDDGNVVILRKDVEPQVDIIKTDKLDKSALVRPFTLLGGSLYRAEIYTCTDANYLFLDFHHIVCDGTSEAVMIEDISNAYLGKMPEDETYTGYEIALAEQIERASARFGAAREYYEKLLRDVGSDYIMKNDMKAGKAGLACADIISDISVDAISKFAADNGATPNGIFNFAFGLVLSRFIYKDDAYFTTIYSGRSDPRTERDVSMLVKTLPVFIKYDVKEKISAAVSAVSEQLRTSQANDIFSFSDIVTAHGVSADVMFAYQGDNFVFDSIGGERAEVILLDSTEPKSAFSLDVFIEGGKYRFRFEYDGLKFGADTVNSFFDSMECVLLGILTKQTIGEIEFVGEKQLSRYDAFNDTAVPVPNVPLCKLFSDSVKANPDKTAVIARDGKYTYSELDSAANKVANTVIDRGLTVGDKAAVLMPRVKDAYAVRQGMMKSGAAFVPIDPKYPDERIEYIISTSGAKAVISTREIIASKREMIDKLGVSALAIEDILENGRDSSPCVDIPQSAVCYIIFTSGSTGKPKGVMITNRNIVNYCLDGRNLATYEYRYVGNVVSCSFASLSFDASIQEECVPLSHGYTVVIASDEDIENPLVLAETMKKNGVNLMFLTPSYVSNALDAPDFVAALKQLKVLDMGAEAVSPELVSKLREAGVEAEIYNGYGPTETTVTCTYHHVTDKYITIGKPVGNTKLYLLDKYGKILPINAIGDLTIAGESVGAGYLGLPEKTAQSFISVRGDRAYRSGDLARYNSEGNVEFFGRLDNQVKLRGLRVELDEIEKAINSFEYVTSSVVIVKNSEAEGDHLVAYYTARKDFDKSELISFISKTLTPYMIPKIMVKLDKMPLTPNGKIDKRALPEPQASVEKRNVKAPTTELGKKIAAIFCRALGVSEVGVDDDFFDLGGTSLSASKVAMLALAGGIAIAYKDVFDYPSVKELEEHINAGAKGTENQVVKTENIRDNEGAISHNICENVDRIKLERPLGTVLLTGATGFLGAHVLFRLLADGCNVVALVRGGRLDAKTRLDAMMLYYFDAPMNEWARGSVDVVDADITAENIDELLDDVKFDTVINCAACVKHFAADDIIERINVGGLKNMIRVAKAHGARLIQISTLSVAGENVGGKFADEFRVHENELDVGQDISNKYVNSKFMAERAVLDAIDGGLDAKIIRVGNLMGRQSDGEFQINSITNGFIRDLKGYKSLGLFPVSGCDARIDFSPIDEVAKAVVLLSQTPREFTLFHAANSHEVEMGDVIDAMNSSGFDIKIVDDETFNSALSKMMEDDEKNMLVSSLISYSSSDSLLHKFILTDNTFTIKALYRLGYRWPITDDDYLLRVIEALRSLDFFTRGDI